MSLRHVHCVVVFVAVSGLALPIGAQTEGGSARWVPQVLGTQITVIAQQLGRFDAPYSGPMSLVAEGDHAVSHTYGVYLGVHMALRLDGYLDVEMARGSGISHASGLAGVSNGDVLRQGTADLGNGPYVARAFLRYLVPLTGAVDSLARGIDQLAEPVARNVSSFLRGSLPRVTSSISIDMRIPHARSLSTGGCSRTPRGTSPPTREGTRTDWRSRT